MKTMTCLFFVLASCQIFAQNDKSVGPCSPVTGDATNQREKTLNKYKNGPAKFDPAKKATVIPFAKIVTAARENDSSKFKVGEYVQVEGYLVEFTEEGPESCNCHKANASAKTGDVHIYIGATASAPKDKCMVVEITPAFKALHPNYESMLIKGKKVTVTGYFLYDYLHNQNSVNYCTDCSKANEVWRKTCWEIHPVIKIM